MDGVGDAKPTADLLAGLTGKAKGARPDIEGARLARMVSPRERWAETLSGPIDDSVAILREVRDAGHRLLGLTNWSGETYRMAQDLMPFLQHMKYTAVSGDLKMGKPEPEIFQHLLGVIGKPAEACAFIDDSPANIAAKMVAGMPGTCRT